MIRGMKENTKKAAGPDGASTSIVYNILLQTVIVVLPIITVPYLSRMLGADAIGIYSYTQSIINYFAMVAVLGVTNYGSRTIASTRTQGKEAVSEVFWGIAYFQLLFGLFVVGCYTAYLVLFCDSSLLISSSLWIIYLISIVFDVTWFFNGMEQFKITAIRGIAVKLITTCLFFLLIRSPSDLFLYIGITAIGALAAQLVLWPSLLRETIFLFPNQTRILPHLKPNITLFIPVLAIGLYTNIDRTMLGSMCSFSENGNFDYSEKIVKMPLAIVTAISMVMLSRASASLASGMSKKAEDELHHSLMFCAVYSGGLVFCFFGVATDIATYFLGEGFERSSSLISILAISIPFLSFTGIIGRQFLIPRKKDIVYTASILAGLVINIVANLILIPRAGAAGAAVATVAAECAVAIIQACSARNDIKLMRIFLSYCVFFCVGFVALLSLGVTSLLPFEGFALLVVKICWFVIAYAAISLVVLFVFNPRELQFYKAQFTKRPRKNRG